MLLGRCKDIWSMVCDQRWNSLTNIISTGNSWGDRCLEPTRYDRVHTKSGTVALELQASNLSTIVGENGLFSIFCLAFLGYLEHKLHLT